MKCSVIVITALLVLCVAANASVPPMISYQGKLMQPSGAPVPDGTYQMQFAVYDVPTGGTALWSETNPSVQVKNGLFATMLGSVINLPSNIFDGQNRFFGVKVGGDPEMTPRQRVASSAFAFRAAVAGAVDDGAIGTSKVMDGAIATGKLADSSVSAVKIAEGAVSTSKIADGAVTATKVADGSVSTAKIAAGAVGSANLAQSQSWIAPTLVNSWVNYTTLYGGDFSPCGYYKDIIGVVHLRGLIVSGQSGAIVFTLDPGYRPAYHLVISAMTGTPDPTASARVDVGHTGEVMVVSSYKTWVSLDTISFRAEQ